MTTPANRYCTGCDLYLHLAPATTLNLQCIAFSIIAILANVPLMTNPLFGPHDPEDVNLVGVAGSDAEIIKKAEAGEVGSNLNTTRARPRPPAAPPSPTESIPSPPVSGFLPQSSTGSTRSG